MDKTLQNTLEGTQMYECIMEAQLDQYFCSQGRSSLPSSPIALVASFTWHPWHSAQNVVILMTPEFRIGFEDSCQRLGSAGVLNVNFNQRMARVTLDKVSHLLNLGQVPFN